MAKTALIGYTGFVGGNIASQHQFDDLYNTSNINDINGQSYDLVVSAATYAEMWKINQDPQGDLDQINGLIAHLKKIKTKKFVLISTVGVYKNPAGADEDTPIDLNGLAPYGANRYHLEEFVHNSFDSLIIRLPGLFGRGLKKNVVYDLAHDNMVDKIHLDGAYQYYNLKNIWRDINTALKNNLKLVNFTAEPVASGELAKYCFDKDISHQRPEGITPPFWDVHSKHAELFGGRNPYLYSKQQELDGIREYLRSQT